MNIFNELATKEIKLRRGLKIKEHEVNFTKLKLSSQFASFKAGAMSRYLFSRDPSLHYSRTTIYVIKGVKLLSYSVGLDTQHTVRIIKQT